MEKDKVGLNEETLEKGISYMKKSIFGPDVTEKLLSVLRAPGDDWDEQVGCWTFGYIYQRPGLDVRTRCLTSIAMISVQGDAGAENVLYQWLSNVVPIVGVTDQELLELFIMVSLFAGLPKSSRALEILQEVVEKRKSVKTTKR